LIEHPKCGLRTRTSKGVGKEFSHVLGVTATNASEERQRGKAPMGRTERSGGRQVLGRRPES